MKLIAVNINKALAKKASAFDATKRAWKLNEVKFRKNLPDFVIGVASGIIKGYYKFEDVNTDIEPKRVKFTLTNCDKNEISRIDTFTSERNLKYFVIKHKW